MTVHEITKTDTGAIVVAVWEWRNGYNLVDTYPATEDQIARFNAGDGLPVPIKWIVQCRDLEEGFGARWSDLKNGEFSTPDEARVFIRKLRETDGTDEGWTLYQYRITEKGSALYYSQPTDALEY